MVCKEKVKPHNTKGNKYIHKGIQISKFLGGEGLNRQAFFSKLHHGH